MFLGEGLVQQFLDQIEVGVQILDESGKVLYRNSMYDRLIGSLALPEQYCPFCLQAHPPGGDTPPDPCITKTWASSFRAVYERNDQQGSLRFLQTLIYETRSSPDGSRVFFQILHDISEIVRLQRQLKESEELFRTLADTASCAIFIYRDRFLYVNHVTTRITGRSREDLLQRHIWEVVHPEDRDLIRQRARERIAGREVPRLYEFRVIRPNGETRWILFTADRIRYQGEWAALGTAFDITERREAILKLRKSERLYRALFEATSDAIVRIHEDTLEILEANPIFLSWTGWEEEEARQHRLSEVLVIPQHAQSDLRPPEKDVLGWVKGKESHIPVSIRWNHENLNGEPLTFVVLRDMRREEAYRAELERYSAHLSMIRDLDRAILQAQDVEDLARVVLENSRLLIPYDRATLIVRPLQEGGMADVYSIPCPGCPMEQVRIPETQLEPRKILLEDRIRWLEPLDPSRSSLSPALRGLRSQGFQAVLTFALVAGNHLLGELNFASRTTGTFRNLHLNVGRDLSASIAIALHQAQLRHRVALQDQQQRILLEKLPMGMVILDRDGELRYQNPLAEHILNRTAHATLQDMIRDWFSVPLSTWLEQPVPESTLVETTDEHGSTLYLMVTRYAIPLPPQGEPGCVLVFQDVTQQRKKEKYLEQQQRLAAIGQLAAGVAHDFNQILQVLTTTTELLREELPAETPEISQKIEDILTEIRHARTLIGQMLDFSRREAADRVPLELVRFLKEFFRFIRRTLPSSIHMVTRFPGQEIWIQMDPTHLQQILLNLAQNAADAMPEGGTLTLALEVVPAEETPVPPELRTRSATWVRIQVQDTGVGMDATTLDHIFEPFFTTKHARGTGLGLPQVYGLVQQHEGAIDVTSQPGEGTTFSLYFPVFQEVSTHATSEDRDLPSSWSRGKGEHLFLVEDHARTRKRLKELLERMGYRVSAFAQPIHAIHALDPSDLPVLLLVDYSLPQMNGLELAVRLRELHPDLRVVLLTGHPSHPRTHPELPDLVVVNKPISQRKLSDTLHTLLSP